MYSPWQPLLETGVVERGVWCYYGDKPRKSCALEKSWHPPTVRPEPNIRAGPFPFEEFAGADS